MQVLGGLGAHETHAMMIIEICDYMSEYADDTLADDDAPCTCMGAWHPHVHLTVSFSPKLSDMNLCHTSLSVHRVRISLQVFASAQMSFTSMKDITCSLLLTSSPIQSTPSESAETGFVGATELSGCFVSMFFEDFLPLFLSLAIAQLQTTLSSAARHRAHYFTFFVPVQSSTSL